MEKGLLEKTGKPLSHWIKIVKASKIEKHKAIIDFLKAEHGFTYGFANFVSLKARAADAGSIDDADLLATQYKGKEKLKPIYEKLLSEFALIKPATKTRIDLGLKIKDKAITGRLEKSGPFGAMCTHRVQLTEVTQVDKELVGWLKEAYEKAG